MHSFPNRLRALFVPSIEKRSRQVTDVRSDTVSPRFDPVALAAEDDFEFGDEDPPPVDVHRLDWKARKSETFVEKTDGGGGVYGGRRAAPGEEDAVTGRRHPAVSRPHAKVVVEGARQARETDGERLLRMTPVT